MKIFPLRVTTLLLFIFSIIFCYRVYKSIPFSTVSWTIFVPVLFLIIKNKILTEIDWWQLALGIIFYFSLALRLDLAPDNFFQLGGFALFSIGLLSFRFSWISFYLASILNPSLIVISMLVLFFEKDTPSKYASIIQKISLHLIGGVILFLFYHHRESFSDVMNIFLGIVDKAFKPMQLIFLIGIITYFGKFKGNSLLNRFPILIIASLCGPFQTGPNLTFCWLLSLYLMYFFKNHDTSDRLLPILMVIWFIFGGIF